MSGPTMVYEVDLGDGRIVEIEGPEGATAEQLQAVLAEQQDGPQFTASVETETFDAAGKPVGADYAGEVFDRDGQSMGLQGSVTDDGASLSDVGSAFANVGAGLAEGALALPDALWDAATGTQRLINQGLGAAGGAALDAVGAEGAADWWRKGSEGLESDLTRRAKPSTPITNAAPVPDDAAGWAARFLSQVVGGAAVPLPAGAARKPSIPTAASPSEGSQGLAAAQRLNQQFGTKIEPLPADVSGPGIRNLTGGAAKLPLAAQPIVKAAERVGSEAQAARDAIAKLAGNATELETAGEAALKGAQSFIKSSKNKVGALYTRARNAGGDQPVDLANARQALDDQIEELSQVPGGAPGLEKLQALRSQLDKPYPVEGVRGMRTNLRDQFASDGLRGSDIERRVGMVVDAAENDIIASLQAAGKGEAAAAYKAAAAAHKERVELIDNVIAPIIGVRGSAPKSGEEIMTAISSATQRNNARLGKFIENLPKDDAATVRATLIGGLGKASKGTQNAAGDGFSLPQFLTHWNGMTPSAKRTLFGAELRTALDDLATVAQGTKEAQRFANFANTGSPLGLIATGAGSTQIFSNPVETIALLAGQYGLGRMLSSPRFARWLARAPKQPSAVVPHVNRLSVIAASEPAIAQDVLGLQARLSDAFGAARVAADEPNDHLDRPVPVENR